MDEQLDACWNSYDITVCGMKRIQVNNVQWLELSSAFVVASEKLLLMASPLLKFSFVASIQTDSIIRWFECLLTKLQCLAYYCNDKTLFPQIRKVSSVLQWKMMELLWMFSFQNDRTNMLKSVSMFCSLFWFQLHLHCEEATHLCAQEMLWVQTHIHWA